MEFTAIITLLMVDILLNVLGRIWDSQKPKPLTFLEMFNFIYDQNEDLVKILQNENEKTRREALEQYLKMKDLFKKGNDEK